MGININNNYNIPENIKKNETVVFIPPIKKGRVVQIYDVNTLIIATKIPEVSNKTYRFTIDIKGIKVPSTRSRNKYEKRFAKEAREYLNTFCLNDIVELRNIICEGDRLKADIYCGYICLGKWLENMGYAINENDDFPNDWEKYRINYLAKK